MSRPLDRLFSRLDASYRDETYFVRMKARLLAGLCLLVIVFIPLNVLKLLAVEPPFLGVRLGMNLIFLTAAASSLWWASKGKLQAAGNGISLIALIPVHAVLFLIPEFHEPLSAGISLFGYDLVCLLIALVFASRPIAFLLLTVIVVTQVWFHWAVLGDQPVVGSMSFTAATLLRDGLIITGFVFCLGITLSVLLETAHRRSEEALEETRATNLNLERLVSERTAELHAARERAEQASRAKGDFLANMSHEIRTPLHAIIAASELLVHRSDLHPEAADKARIIEESGELLLKQIGDILDLSKIESGHIELENTPFELRRLMAECLEIVAPQAQAAGVQMESRADPTLASGYIGDGFRLRQVLLNLLSNAIKFTPAGGLVQLNVSCAVKSSLPQLLFEVKDQGVGMDAAVLERVFRRFVQADSTTTRHHGGTGLGLPIAMLLVERMGGRLEAQSTPGKGSSFFFTLALEVAGENLLPEQCIHRPAPVQGCELEVLVADDNATNRKIIGLQLEKLGCRYAMATDGLEVLAALKSGPLPDMILMDCEMPNLDGLETTRRLRSWAKADGATELQRVAARLPVIALSAATSPEQQALCMEAGMNDFLAKPMRLASLHRQLQKISLARSMHNPPPC